MDDLSHEAMAIETARRFARERLLPKVAEIDTTDEVPWDLVREMHALGLVGVTLPEEFGGLGASTTFFAEVLEEIAAVSPVLANINMVQSCYADFLVKFASDEIKRIWAPAIVAGEKIISVAMTEPGAGSDIANIRTTARKTDGGFVIKGEKQFITLGLVCDAAIVFAASEDASDRKSRMSAYFVEADRRGFGRGRKEQLMGMHGEATGSLVLDDVEIPASHRIGAAGKGFEIAEYSFNLGRIAIAALALGIARGCIELSARYAAERQAFGRAIGRFQGVSFMLADNFARLEAAREIVHRAAAKRDSGAFFFIDASIGKLLASDVAVKAAGDAVQILGGAGYTKEYPAERFFRDAKVTQIYEGTNQIQRMIIGNYVVRGNVDKSYKLAV
ncbi:MAG: acyl-CoA dehydrogenase family protein [Pararhizobium sp.]